VSNLRVRTLADAAFQGAHSRDPNAARAAMLGTVTREKVAAHLREGWMNVMPGR
jgi:hypothetical protein